MGRLSQNILAGAILLIFLSACSKNTGMDPDEGPEKLSIYVTVALHIEDTRAYANCSEYPNYRQKLLDFAEAIAPYHAAINLQVEYEFFTGVSRCETLDMQKNTNDQNALEYLVSQYQYEIDPHQEGGWDIEGQDNYADIRFLGGQVTTGISETMGGLVWDDPMQWNRLSEGERGLIATDYVWTPEALTLAVGSNHHRGDFSADDYASGVWIPKGVNTDFWKHDPEGSIIYIGPGEYANFGDKHPHRTTLEFINELQSRYESGEISHDRIYTATIGVPQSVIFKSEEQSKLLEILDEIEELVKTGAVVYANYSQILKIWRDQYEANPNIFYLD